MISDNIWHEADKRNGFIHRHDFSKSTPCIIGYFKESVQSGASNQ